MPRFIRRLAPYALAAALAAPGLAQDSGRADSYHCAGTVNYKGENYKVCTKEAGEGLNWAGRRILGFVIHDLQRMVSVKEDIGDDKVRISLQIPYYDILLKQDDFEQIFERRHVVADSGKGIAVTSLLEKPVIIYGVNDPRYRGSRILYKSLDNSSNGTVYVSPEECKCYLDQLPSCPCTIRNMAFVETDGGLDIYFAVEENTYFDEYWSVYHAEIRDAGGKVVSRAEKLSTHHLSPLRMDWPSDILDLEPPSEDIQKYMEYLVSIKGWVNKFVYSVSQDIDLNKIIEHHMEKRKQAQHPAP